jgi:hypothetical protein
MPKHMGQFLSMNARELYDAIVELLKAEGRASTLAPH